jgi:hypothetical protein
MRVAEAGKNDSVVRTSGLWQLGQAAWIGQSGNGRWQVNLESSAWTEQKRTGQSGQDSNDRTIGTIVKGFFDYSHGLRVGPEDKWVREQMWPEKLYLDTLWKYTMLWNRIYSSTVSPISLVSTVICILVFTYSYTHAHVYKLYSMLWVFHQVPKEG